MAAILRWHYFQMHLLQLKSINFDKDFTEVFFQGAINNIPALVQIMAWCRSGNKPLFGVMLVNLLTHLFITQSQLVNCWQLSQIQEMIDSATIFSCHLKTSQDINGERQFPASNGWVSVMNPGDEKIALQYTSLQIQVYNVTGRKPDVLHTQDIYSKSNLITG